MSKKQTEDEEEIVEVAMRCVTCEHWKRDVYPHMATGRCRKSLLQCPPMHRCKGWEEKYSMDLDNEDFD